MRALNTLIGPARLIGKKTSFPFICGFDSQQLIAGVFRADCSSHVTSAADPEIRGILL